MLNRIREICLALPDVNERPSHGEPCWFYKNKRVVCMFDDHHHGAERTAVWVPAPPGVAAGLVSGETSPPNPLSIETERGSRYFIPPYVGVKGWVGVRVDLPDTDWDELAGLIGQAWEMVSSKR
ncbi:MAG: MmcQ/YjbR family DNA-binding protein [Fimbriimonadaceae bacterium]|nr:MAG: MmcQ/YjbR family DNA-binding protein [Fimbriimonadaceae bacterium]